MMRLVFFFHLYFADLCAYFHPQSHDQRLEQTIEFMGRQLHFSGGTTKCARVMIQYLADLHRHVASSSAVDDSKKSSEVMRGKAVLEVGSGTGIVGICSAVLGAKHVCLTDQEAVLVLICCQSVVCRFQFADRGAWFAGAVGVQS
jgi:hypothetical protein